MSLRAWLPGRGWLSECDINFSCNYSSEVHLLIQSVSHFCGPLEHSPFWVGLKQHRSIFLLRQQGGDHSLRQRGAGSQEM